MRAEILCVGSELLLGQIIDTNAAYIAGRLARAGIDVHRKQTVGDNLERIVECIQGALSRADVLVITGGLGPTTDDLTRDAISQALDAPLEFDESIADHLRAWFARRQVKIVDSILRQAYVPRGVTALDNPAGTAPGLRGETTDKKLIFAVPGVPREMKVLLDESIIPYLLERVEGKPQIIVSRVLRSFGIGESMIAEPIEDILTSSQNPTAAPLIFGNTEVHLRLTAKAENEAHAKELLDELEAKIRQRVGEHIFGIDDQTLPSVLLERLQAQNATLGVAESLTGGVLNAFLTDVPGASQTLRGGVIAYSAELKEKLLGVPREVIDGKGVVNEETAIAMAEGIRKITGATFGVSTTGEAGPQSQSGADVGTVFIGIADQNGSRAVERHFTGDRDAIRRRASLAALDILRRQL
ncbi:MAG TPA: competence/damage-inducible protein A [Abditibacteriaceae bacterium]|jgi:nicotinamide-nucleotide amidase